MAWGSNRKAWLFDHDFCCLIFHFFFSSLGGKKKEEKNNQIYGKKSCLSARSFNGMSHNTETSQSTSTIDFMSGLQFHAIDISNSYINRTLLIKCNICTLQSTNYRVQSTSVSEVLIFLNIVEEMYMYSNSNTTLHTANKNIHIFTFLIHTDFKFIRFNIKLLLFERIINYIKVGAVAANTQMKN